MLKGTPRGVEWQVSEYEGWLCDMKVNLEVHMFSDLCLWHEDPDGVLLCDLFLHQKAQNLMTVPWDMEATVLVFRDSLAQWARSPYCIIGLSNDLW